MNDTSEARMQSLFQPILTVDDDGRIDFDFGQSYTNTVNETTQEERYDDPHDHHVVLDTVLGQGTTVEKLRRLANHIEAQDA